MSIPKRDEALSIDNQQVAELEKAPFWSSGLLIASSLALGGIAVALWNRQSLRKMRAAETEGGPGFGRRFPREQVAFFEYQPPADENVPRATQPGKG